MPLKEIERYMTMASDQKYASCYSVLCEHKLRIESELAEMNATLEIMTYKMDHFQDMMKRSGLGADVPEEQNAKDPGCAPALRLAGSEAV